MTCGNKSVIKRTVLFFKYSLKNTATGKYKDFTYVKLEGYGMKKMKDIIGHSIQYLKTRFRSSKNVSKRVETTKLLNNRVYKRPNAARKVCKMIPNVKIGSSCSTRDTFEEVMKSTYQNTNTRKHLV